MIFMFDRRRRFGKRLPRNLTNTLHDMAHAMEPDHIDGYAASLEHSPAFAQSGSGNTSRE
jgi:hypothetical protein